MFKKIILSVAILWSCELLSQDPHFSIFYGVPVGLNPAYTGNFNGNFRVGAQYRDQWASLGRENMSIAGYKTALASFEARTNRGFDEHDFVGAGFFFLHDVAGESRFKNTKYAVSASYRKSLNEYGDHFIAVGGQLGMIQKSINLSNLTWGNQWDGTQFNSLRSSGEQFQGIDDNIAFYDASVGLMWGYNIYNSRNRFFAGLGLMHINTPTQSFFARNNAGSTIDDASIKLPMKINFNAGAGIQVSEKIDVMPKFLYMNQAKNLETIIGSDIRFLFDPNDEYENSFYLGLMTRIVGGDPANVQNIKSMNMESVIASMRMDFNSLEVGAAYDFNVSQLRNSLAYQGGFEVYFNYTFRIESNSQRRMFCPKF